MQRELLGLTNQVIAASQLVNRLKGIADQITNSGAAPANLETSTEALVPVGTGSTLYSGIGQIKTALDGLATLVSAIDQG